MDKETAVKLIEELSKHPSIITPNKDLFLEVLLKTDVPSSSRFYEETSDVQQPLEEKGSCRYHHLSLRRVLRNENARDYQLALWKKGFEALLSVVGASYDSDVITRRLRADQALVEMMTESWQQGNPFTLLGKMQTCDYSNEGGILYRMTKPILAIPGISIRDMRRILFFEEENSVYEKEVGAILRHFVRIPKGEYLSNT